MYIYVYICIYMYIYVYICILKTQSNFLYFAQKRCIGTIFFIFGNKIKCAQKYGKPVYCSTSWKYIHFPICLSNISDFLEVI